MRRKTYGCVVLYEDKHSKMTFEHLGVFIKVKNTNVQKRCGGGSYNPWGLINRDIGHLYIEFAEKSRFLQLETRGRRKSLIVESGTL